MQASTVSNSLPHFGDQPFRDIHGEPPALTPPVKCVVRMEFTGGTGRTLRANTAALPQRDRADRHRPHLPDRFDKPRSYIVGCLTSHVHMLLYMCLKHVASDFFDASGRTTARLIRHPLIRACQAAPDDNAQALSPRLPC
jgi:hypothetical protein